MNKQETEDKIEELKTEYSMLEEQENEEQYNDFIDDVSSEIEIMGMKFLASRILKEIDPVAYDCGFSDFNDERMSELEEEIKEKEEELSICRHCGKVHTNALCEGGMK